MNSIIATINFTRIGSGYFADISIVTQRCITFDFKEGEI